MKKLSLKKLSLAVAISSLIAASQWLAPSIAFAQNNQPPAFAVQPLKIQIALLLDTSSSMDGLIDQTRVQLWQMVDELGKAKKNGQVPKLEVAVYEYGNDSLPARSGHIRQVVGFTSELDRVSEALFALTTNGGSEYCGYVINDALQKLQWSRKASDLQLMVIAGNEPFSQGPVAYRDAIAAATKAGITVSTIFAGDYAEGAGSGWQEAAQLAGGNFMNIDQNQAIVHVPAPQDSRLHALNQQLNSTYIPYGAQGTAAYSRQQEQDAQNAAVSSELAAKRSKVKSSAVYKNSHWDLVDAIEENTVELDKVANKDLPQPMQTLSLDEKKAYLAEKKSSREAIKKEIQQLSEERETFVAAKKAELSKTKTNADMSDALSQALASQANKQGFELELNN